MLNWSRIRNCSLAILIAAGLPLIPTIAFAGPLNACQKACNATYSTCMNGAGHDDVKKLTCKHHLDYCTNQC